MSFHTLLFVAASPYLPQKRSAWKEEAQNQRYNSQNVPKQK